MDICFTRPVLNPELTSVNVQITREDTAIFLLQNLV